MNMQIEEIEKIENEIVGLGYLSPKEFLDIVADTSNDLNLKIINTDVKWKTYQRRKNGDVLCYTHIFSTIKTNKKPLKPAIWMLPTSPLPDYIDITFKYAFDFTFNKKTKTIKNLKVLKCYHNHQELPSKHVQINLSDDNIKGSLVNYVQNALNLVK
jgi:hypothetical protein